ncbi:MAG: hypothetical protein Q9164_003536 [Protoblastenia rupestris]
MSTADPLAPLRAQSTPEPLDANHDERSSSLSEIGETTANCDLDTVVHTNDNGEANDTEAETERLEDTPLKRRRHQNVVLTAEKRVYSSRSSPSGTAVLNGQLQQTSDISSLEDSSEEGLDHRSLTSSPRKRKRLSLEDESISSRPSANGNKGPSSNSLSPSLTSNTAEATSEQALQEDNIVGSGTEGLQRTPTKKQKSKTGKRKEKKTPTLENTQVDTAIGRVEEVNAIDGGENVYSNGEDVEIEDLGDAELDNAGKDEEGLLKKKSALDSLTALEKCFATLRDKLFDERLASANEELVLLQRPGFAHPELLAMKEAVDQRRDEKIRYQRTHLRYKLQSLQKESVATKHQALSQYMQTVREVRDRSLDQLNKEFYQIQRERRSVEGDVPDFMYTFTDKRSKQITQQTAYNVEVSVLSGVAKHVGFPAAPRIRIARPNELDEDMQNMGIVLQPPQLLQTRQPQLRASYSTAANPRQTPAVEDFLERNAWANPHHSAHYQQRQQIHRQVSNLSRVSTPSSTPAAQKGVTDLSKPQGSASTVVEPHSGPNSSMAPTPTTGEQSRAPLVQVNAVQAQRVVDNTPSRTPSPLPKATPVTETISETLPPGSRMSNSSKPDRDPSPQITRNHSAQDSQTPSALPRPLPFTQSAASRASPPVRMSVKIEDVGLPAGHSSIPNQFSSPAPAIAAGNGQRFGSR